MLCPIIKNLAVNKIKNFNLKYTKIYLNNDNYIQSKESRSICYQNMC